MAHDTVHMLWVKGPLGRLAKLSLASFKRQGFRIALWTYDKAPLANHGVDLRDASEIVPLADNMAALSSLFRYRVLALHGGLWSDLDVVALAGPGALPNGPFIATEKRRPFRHAEATATGEALTQVTNCFMGGSSMFWQQAADAVEGLPPEERSWEAVGPHMLSRLMIANLDHGLDILPPDMVDTVAWWNVPAYFLEVRDPPPHPFLHMYNSIWAKRGVDPEKPFPPGSLIERLCRDHGV